MRMNEKDKGERKFMCNLGVTRILQSSSCLLETTFLVLIMLLKKQKEEEERMGKEEAEAHASSTIIKVARDKNLREQIGMNIYFGLMDTDYIDFFYVSKHSPFTRLEVAALEALNGARLCLFLEVELGQDLNPLPPPIIISRNDILIFFKLYEPEKMKIRYVGRMSVEAVGMPLEILPKLKELAGFPRSLSSPSLIHPHKHQQMADAFYRCRKCGAPNSLWEKYSEKNRGLCYKCRKEQKDPVEPFWNKKYAHFKEFCGIGGCQDQLQESELLKLWREGQPFTKMQP